MENLIGVERKMLTFAMFKIAKESRDKTWHLAMEKIARKLELDGYYEHWRDDWRNKRDA